MHPTNRVPQITLCSLLLGLTLCGTAISQGLQAPGQPKDGQAAPGGSGMIVPINGTRYLQMTSKKRILKVVNPNERVAVVQSMAGDPTTVMVTGREAGTTRITLTSEDNVQENLDIVVQADVEYLRTMLQQIVPTASIQPIPVGNSMIVLKGHVDRAEDVDVIVKTAERAAGGAFQVQNALQVGGVQQVQLDVVVAQVSRSELRRMSFDFLDVGQHHVLASALGGLTIPQQALAPAALPGIPPVFDVVTPNGGSPNVFLSVFNNKQSFFGFLQALRDENVAKLMAEPRLMALSGRQASFLSGGEQAIPVPAGLGQIGVQFEEFGTRLNFLPIVLGDGKIHLEVEPEVSSLNAANGVSIQGTVVPGRDTQRVRTVVRLEPGQTFAIGGLIQRNITGTTSKVPVLGDLPFIGAAFSRKSFDERESELVILVTPHLVDAMSCDELKALPGQETRSPDDFELFLEGILEAPRGPRAVCHDRCYVPAYKNGPTSALFPCAGDDRCGGPGCRERKPASDSCPRPGTLRCRVVETKPAAMEPTRAAYVEPITPPMGRLPTEVAPPVEQPKPASLPALPMGQGGTEGHQE